MPATIKEVAERAGVNPSTVSRVINEDPKLSIREETRNRILQAIEELQYRPNAVARSLRLKTTGTVGMIIPDITNPFFPEIIKGAESAASERELSLILCNTDENPEKERSYIELLTEKQVDGILLASAYIQDETVDLVTKRKIPYVLVNRTARNAVGASVRVDDVLGAQLAIQHLVALGHRRIAHISGLLYTETGLDRLEGYRRTLNQCQIPFLSEYMVEARFSERDGYLAMERLLALPDPPTGVFAANDLIALGAMSAIRDHGWSVPEDISVVGFNDTWLAEKVHPPLTSVKVPLYDMGYLAVESLARKILGETMPQDKIVLKPELMIRRSTDAATARTRVIREA
ncbi:MAG: LacI family transcriptional regulator [Firmicutes bacterium]|nr:LacI family transcriptional regulator [Bacillota bacterium]